MADVNEPKLWVVETGTQEVNLVCRIFACEQDAQAYAATAREWLARHVKYMGEEKGPDRRWPEGFYRQILNQSPDHRTDLVDEAKAASEVWPFGDDPHSDFFSVAAYPFVPEAKPSAQGILDALLAHGDHLPHCDKWPDCTCGYVLAIETARGDVNKQKP